jgi:formate dehydrogenase major subunit
MVASVREGKLIAMEGDYDHIVNRGSLCVKGISMFATHSSPNRLSTPRYRAPGSEHWEEISWETSLHIDLIAADRGLKRLSSSLYDL